MLKKLIKIIGLLSLIGSYGMLIWYFVQHGFVIEFTPLSNWAWVLGAVSLVSNGAYAILTNVDEFLLSIYGCTGFIWLAPFFIDVETLYGIPALVIFLFIAIYLHMRKTQSGTINE
ncbi:MAG: hypothetical protein KTR22_04775 [Flavobacteriaceae bacterium]|nr:hypothetical protein [Flavobacteriaceae bacterium]